MTIAPLPDHLAEFIAENDLELLSSSSGQVTLDEDDDSEGQALTTSIYGKLEGGRLPAVIVVQSLDGEVTNHSVFMYEEIASIAATFDALGSPLSIDNFDKVIDAFIDPDDPGPLVFPMVTDGGDKRIRLTATRKGPSSAASQVNIIFPIEYASKLALALLEAADEAGL